MQRPARLVTADELERMPDDDYRYELVAGRLVRMSPVGGSHGAVAIRLGSLLAAAARRGGLGFVVTEVGFLLANGPDTVRAPDLAFVRRGRSAGGKPPRGFWTGPPDMAVEVLSPDDRPADMGAKVNEYLTSGVQLVWVVDPDERTVAVHRPHTNAARFGEDDALDADDVLPGFHCGVRDIFDV